MTSELRKDFFLNKYVLITPGRASRPKDIHEETIINRTPDCPFCPDNIDLKNIIAETNNKCAGRIISIKNIFPAVTLNNPSAYGVQEVVIETPDHQRELGDLTENEIEGVLRMYALRTKELSKNKKLDYILCFKNQGSKAGASIVHAHSQIFATALVPPDILEELTSAKDYQKRKHTCPFCDQIKIELNSERRIFSDKHISAFSPFASQYHYEVWFFTNRHLDNITKLNDNEFRSFAAALKSVLGKLKTLGLSFNFFLHQVVSNHDQHFYLKIQPRDSVWAGVELGSGLVINSMPPEEAALFYRS